VRYVRHGVGRCNRGPRKTQRRNLGKLTALLDVAAGIEYEGEAKPAASEDDQMAIKALNLLSNGMGGIDYAGLPLVAAHLGVDDVDGLLVRFFVIKSRRPAGASS
jgi:hypothetical protein